MMEQRIVGLGEVLWDVFADGPRFGGAPANFAIHSAALRGKRPAMQVAMVSAVGPASDPLSQPALDALAAHGVDTRYVSQGDCETGRVLVDINSSGHPTYTFSQHPAWDHIAWSDELAELAAHCEIACFGTLAQRASQSRETIQRFLQSMPSESLRIFDVNLRVNFWNNDVILQSLQRADVLKLNDDELPIVAAASNIHCQSVEPGSQDTMRVLQSLLERHSLKLIALTCGASGALLVSGNEIDHCPAPRVVVRDTVGAGDSYTAALALGYTRGWPLARINRLATEVAAYVCTQSGATPELPPDLLRATELAQ